MVHLASLQVLTSPAITMDGSDQVELPTDGRGGCPQLEFQGSLQHPWLAGYQ